MKIKPSSLRIFAAGLASLILMLACSLVTGAPDGPSAPPPTETQPAAINTPLPTDPPEPVSTAAPTDPPHAETPSCYKWDQITLDMAGEEVCVYGTAYSHQGQSRIDFSPEKNSFFLIDSTYYYPNLSAGECIATIEEVEVFDGKIPFMTISGNLYDCEPWMEE